MSDTSIVSLAEHVDAEIAKALDAGPVAYFRVDSELYERIHANEQAFMAVCETIRGRVDRECLIGDSTLCDGEIRVVRPRFTFDEEPDERPEGESQ